MKAGRIVAVASGKGGVGKTWFAITLAHALARDGKRVLLFDGDLGLANVDVQLGLMPEGDLGAVVCGRLSLEAATLHHDCGFDILPGRSGSGSLAALETPVLEQILDALHEAARHYDVVVLDLGAGLDRAVRRMAVFAELLLVVATDEPTSLTDAYAVLKLHAGDAAPDGAGEARIVVNLAKTHVAGERTYGALSRACRKFLGLQPALAGVIRRDDRVRDAIRHQTPLLVRHPGCPAAADVEAIAAQVARARA
jgi:flagellar biosynthesis protein FlhG